MKTNQIGRSMIEMLGVLAIIGVLSVGAIAGYSNAMKKHKLNVQAQGLSLLLQNSINFTSEFKMEEGENISITSFLDKLKVIPDGFKYDKNIDRVIDNFASRINLYSCTAHPSAHNFGLSYNGVSDTNYRFDICVNLINVAKEYRGQIHYLTVTIPDKPQLNYYGDIGCKEGVKCLKTLTIDDIYQMCKVQNYEKQGSHFAFAWF